RPRRLARGCSRAAPAPAEPLRRSADAERVVSTGVGPDLRTLAVELQSLGVRTSDSADTRRGGAGPSDAGFLWIDGAPLTVPVHADYASRSPYELVLNRSGRAGTLFRDGIAVGPVRLGPRPKHYNLETADGIPY